MADNVTANGSTIATDEVSGAHYQLVKVVFGGDGVATLASTGTPLPTVQTGALPAGTANIGDVDVLTLGGQTPAFGAGIAGSTALRVVLASDSAGLDAVEYETVAASATNQTLGAGGATGDYLAGLLVIPATTSPGAVSIKDGGGSAITVFTGGASSVGSLVPFFIPLGIKSTAGAWQVTTGTNVSVVASGNFT